MIITFNIIIIVAFLMLLVIFYHIAIAYNLIMIRILKLKARKLRDKIYKEFGVRVEKTPML